MASLEDNEPYKKFIEMKEYEVVVKKCFVSFRKKFTGGGG